MPNACSSCSELRNPASSCSTIRTTTTAIRPETTTASTTISFRLGNDASLGIGAYEISVTSGCCALSVS